MKKIIATIGLLSLSLSAFSVTQTLDCKSLDGVYTANAFVNISTFEKDIQSEDSQKGQISLYKNKKIVLQKDIPIELVGMMTEGEVTFASTGEDRLESYIATLTIPLASYAKAGEVKATVTYSLMQDREDLEDYSPVDLNCKATAK